MKTPPRAFQNQRRIIPRPAAPPLRWDAQVARPPAIRRVLLVAPGHKWSTYDVHTGLHGGLTACGVESWPFAMDERVKNGRALMEWRIDTGIDEPADEKEIETAGIMLASQEAVIQALAVEADAVVVVSGLMFDPRIYVLLARARKPVLIFGTESPYHDGWYEQIAPLVPAFSTNDAASLDRLAAAVSARSGDTRVLHLPLGYDPERHRPGCGDGLDFPEHDVVFVGNVYKSRAAMLEGIDWTGIDLGLYGAFITMPEESPLWQYAQMGATPDNRFAIVDNRATAILYDKAKITLNLFRVEVDGLDPDDERQEAGGVSINPRLIEAAATGAFMISEYRPEVEALFGDLVPTFRTPEEADRLIRYYLDRPEERAAIAAQLPEAVAPYSYHVRARQILDTLEDVRADLHARRRI